MEKQDFSVPKPIAEMPLSSNKTEEQKDSVSEEEKDKFFRAIMEDKVYTKEYRLFGDKMVVVLRTRWSKELDMILEKFRTPDQKGPLDFQMIGSMGSLAFSLIRINEQNFDEGSFEERYTRLKQLPGPKIALLLTLLSKFDTHILELQNKAMSPNF